jgi:hypothetical protein
MELPTMGSMNTWQIEGNSTPGVFRVNVVATFNGERAGTLTTFNVIES